MNSLSSDDETKKIDTCEKITDAPEVLELDNLNEEIAKLKAKKTLNSDESKKLRQLQDQVTKKESELIALATEAEAEADANSNTEVSKVKASTTKIIKTPVQTKLNKPQVVAVTGATGIAGATLVIGATGIAGATGAVGAIDLPDYDDINRHSWEIPYQGIYQGFDDLEHKKPLKWVLPNNQNFYNFINEHFEAYTAHEPTTEEPDAKSKILFPHQEIVKQYMKPASPYRGLLVYHGLGSGKTRTSIEVALEYWKLGWNIVLLSSGALKDTFIQELKEWASHSGVNDFKNTELIHFRDPKFQKKNRMFLVSYNHYTLARNLGLDPKNPGLIDLPNTGKNIIIIDEVHDLIATLTKPTNISSEIMYKALMNVKNSKILALTGTPIVNKPYELAILFNILRGPICVDKNCPKLKDSLHDGLSLFPADEEIFNSMFINTETGKVSRQMAKHFKTRIMGLVSYYRGRAGPGVYPRVKDHGIIKVTMSKPHWNQYLKIRQAEIEKEKKALDTNKKLFQRLRIQYGNKPAKMVDMPAGNTFRTDTRLLSNFMFPIGLKRPSKQAILKQEIMADADYKREMEYIPPKPIQGETGPVGPISDEFDEIDQEVNDLAGDAETDTTKPKKKPTRTSKNKPIDNDLDEQGFTRITSEIAGKIYINQIRKLLDKIDSMPKIFSPTNLQTYAPKFLKALQIIGVIGDPNIKVDTQQGLKEPSGSKGSKEPSGSKGSKAPSGSKGSKEPSGLKGPKEPSGSKGPTGPIAKSTGQTGPTEDHSDLKDLKEPSGSKEPKDQSDLKDLKEPSGSKEPKDQSEPSGSKGPTGPIAKSTGQTEPNEPKENIEDRHVYYNQNRLTMDKESIKNKDTPEYKNGGLVFFYSNFLTLEGINMFARALKAYGYKSANIEPHTKISDLKPGVLRYAIMSGDENTDIRSRILDIFNDPKNHHGAYIKILMGTSAAAKGINLKRVRQNIHLDPHWNEGRPNQVKGRGRRMYSHSDLPKAEQELNIYRLFTVLDDEQKDHMKARGHENEILSTDETIYEIAQAKEKMYAPFDIFIKEAAIDCELNRIHNNYRADDETTAPITCFTFGVKPASPPEVYSYSPRYQDLPSSSEPQHLIITAEQFDGKPFELSAKKLAALKAGDPILYQILFTVKGEPKLYINPNRSTWQIKIKEEGTPYDKLPTPPQAVPLVDNDDEIKAWLVDGRRLFRLQEIIPVNENK